MDSSPSPTLQSTGKLYGKCAILYVGDRVHKFDIKQKNLKANCDTFECSFIDRQTQPSQAKVSLTAI